MQNGMQHDAMLQVDIHAAGPCYAAMMFKSQPLPLPLTMGVTEDREKRTQGPEKTTPPKTEREHNYSTQ